MNHELILLSLFCFPRTYRPNNVYVPTLFAGFALTAPFAFFLVGGRERCLCRTFRGLMFVCFALQHLSHRMVSAPPTRAIYTYYLV